MCVVLVASQVRKFGMLLLVLRDILTQVFVGVLRSGHASVHGVELVVAPHGQCTPSLNHGLHDPDRFHLIRTPNDEVVQEDDLRFRMAPGPFLLGLIELREERPEPRGGAVYITDETCMHREACFH